MDAFNATMARRVRAERKFSFGFNAILPVQSPFAKIFLFAPYPNHFHIPAHPTPLEGRIAVVTDAGRDAMDASGASDEGAGLRTAKSCGPVVQHFFRSPKIEENA